MFLLHPNSFQVISISSYSIACESHLVHRTIEVLPHFTTPLSRRNPLFSCQVPDPQLDFFSHTHGSSARGGTTTIPIKSDSTRGDRD